MEGEPSRGEGGAGGGGGTTRLSSPPTHPPLQGQSGVRSRLISFDGLVARNAHGTAWAHSQRQWNRLAQFLTTITS